VDVSNASLSLLSSSHPNFLRTVIKGRDAFLYETSSCLTQLQAFGSLLWSAFFFFWDLICEGWVFRFLDGLF